MNPNQMEMVSLNELVGKGHVYRNFMAILDFAAINSRLSKLKSNNPNEGYGIEILFKCLFCNI
jgi:hypothetical protein